MVEQRAKIQKTETRNRKFLSGFSFKRPRVSAKTKKVAGWVTFGIALTIVIFLGLTRLNNTSHIGMRLFLSVSFAAIVDVVFLVSWKNLTNQ